MAEITYMAHRCKQLGISPRTLLERFEKGIDKPVALGIRLGDAYKDFLKAREMRYGKIQTGKGAKDSSNGGDRSRTQATLKRNLERFVKPRSAMLLRDITPHTISNYLYDPEHGWKKTSVNTHLTSLKTLFIWCKNNDLVEKLPFGDIKKYGKHEMDNLDTPPGILHIVQAARLLRTILRIDPGMANYAALGLFGGLRPEREAFRLKKEDVLEDQIWVRGKNAKTRQARFVRMTHKTTIDGQPYAVDTLKQWLQLDGEFKPECWRGRWDKIREAAGLIRRVKVEGKEKMQIISTGWVQDCARHSFGSHFLPLFGESETSTQLGHGDHTMLYAHYRDFRITRELAKLYWQLTPDVVGDKKKLAALLRQAAPLVRQMKLINSQSGQKVE
jgi:hypothetical protein